MMNQLPVKRCHHCGGEDILVGWQSDALVTFKRNGLLGNRIKFLICDNCGAILYQCVAEPHRFPQGTGRGATVFLRQRGRRTGLPESTIPRRE